MPYKDSIKRERDRAYREAHREEREAYQRAYREANREKRAAWARAYRESAPEKIVTNRRKYSQTHRKQISAKNRAYKSAHRKELAAKSRARYAANPDKMRAAQDAYRARKRGNGGTHTGAEWRYLRDWFGNRCLCCGATGRLAIDHVVPLAKGGSNAIENLQPLCKLCNSVKGVNTTDYRDPLLLSSFLESLQGL